MSEVRLAPHPGLDPEWMLDREWSIGGSGSVRALQERDLDHLRRWRNEQQAVLRQQQPLTMEHQQHWYREVVAPSYRASTPRELLVVVTEDGAPVAYGGLTNIEWTSRRGELSYLAATARAADPGVYVAGFLRFLRWVVDFTFGELEFNRVFTETWEFRVDHMAALEEVGFRREGTMRQHVAKDGIVYDAILHGITRSDWRPS